MKIEWQLWGWEADVWTGESKQAECGQFESFKGGFQLLNSHWKA